MIIEAGLYVSKASFPFRPPYYAFLLGEVAAGRWSGMRGKVSTEPGVYVAESTALLSPPAPVRWAYGCPARVDAADAARLVRRT
jgi:hypothetical protein